MKEKELWYFLLDAQKDAETGIIGNFYSYGDHLGDALNKAIEASAGHEFYDPSVIEASILESIEDIDDNDELVNISADVYMRPTTHSYPLDNDDPIEFIPPVGIVNGVDEGEYEYELIKEEFAAYSANENGFFEFELILSKEHLIETFLKTIDFLPSTDGFWIYIKNYWEDDLTELWMAKHFTDKQVILEFLLAQQANTLENGYVEIIVHSLAGETNLTLDEHKKIQLYTKDEKVFNDFIGKVTKLGFKQTTDQLYNLEFGFYHFHYRPAGSLTRTEFKQMLAKNHFELLDTWEE